MSAPIVDQPPPVANTSRPLWPTVIAEAADYFQGTNVAQRVIDDMRERDRLGRERYGVPLQAGNGRHPLVDAYQEALDLVVYLKQAMEEGRGDQDEIASIYFDTLYQIGRLRRLIDGG